MHLIKNFIINLALLVGGGLILLMIYPEIMEQVFQVFGQFFIPLAIIMLIVAALPKRKSKIKKDHHEEDCGILLPKDADGFIY